MLRGIDISKWQSIGTSDQGEDFVIIKATEGCGYTDPSCDAHYQRAKAAGKLLGVYHFARPDLGNTATAEADWFVHEIQGYIGEAILVLDWEVDTRKTGWAKEFLDRVKELTGVKPLIYMSASVVNGNNWSDVAKADYGLWIAGYPARYNVANPPVPSENDMPYGIGAWSFWAIWQYTSSLGHLDRDIARMDAEAWHKYAAKEGSAPAPAPAPQPAPAPAPQPEPKPAPSTGINVGDKVTLKTWVDYNGTPLRKTRDFYFVKQIDGNRAVLTADSVNGAIYAAANTANLTKVGAAPAPTPIQVGDSVIVNGQGTATSNGGGAVTRAYSNQMMKVITIANGHYGCNQYNQDGGVTAWWSASQVRKA